MKVNSINSSAYIYGFYDSMFRGNASLSSIKLNKDLFPTNKAQGYKQVGEDTLKYISDIKSASKGLSSSLKELTGSAFSKKDATIPEKEDQKTAKSAVEGMVKGYNDLFSASAQNTGDPKAQKLAGKMLSVSKTYSGGLAGVGIGFDRDGLMTIDAAKLDEAEKNGKLEKFFTENNGKNYGFTNQMARLADNVSANTSNYVSRTGFGNNLTENFSYSGVGSLMQYNASSLGWLFDYSY